MSRPIKLFFRRKSASHKLEADGVASRFQETAFSKVAKVQEDVVQAEARSLSTAELVGRSRGST